MSHQFAESLFQKGLLKNYFTTNIENSEVRLQIPKEKILYLNGKVSDLKNFSQRPTCSKCGSYSEADKYEKMLMKGQVMTCKAEFTQIVSTGTAAKQSNLDPTDTIFGIQVS